MYTNANDQYFLKKAKENEIQEYNTSMMKKVTCFPFGLTYNYKIKQPCISCKLSKETSYY